MNSGRIEDLLQQYVTQMEEKQHDAGIISRPAPTEARPLKASAEQEQGELGEPKTDKQMKKLEQENRRLRKILKNLTEERGEQLDEEFEPPRMQDALCQKNYMRRVKRQSRKMEDLIKNLRAAPRNRTRDPDSRANLRQPSDRRPLKYSQWRVRRPSDR